MYWHSNIDTTKELISRIAKYLLKINQLETENIELRRAPERYREYGIEYTIGSTAVYMRPPQDVIYRFVIKPLYEEICKRGIFPPRYPISIGGEYIDSMPFGKNRWIIFTGAAFLPYLMEYIIDEYLQWHRKHPIYEDVMEFRKAIEERWFEKDYEGNMIKREDLEILKDLAPDLYRELKHGIEAVERTNSEMGEELVNLWAWRDMKAVTMDSIIDATDMSIEEVMERIPKMVEAAAMAQRKLIEVYEEELERKMREEPYTKLIRVKVDPCERRMWGIGNWILASW